MKIERVDEKTVKCYLSVEELEAYQIDYKDFLTRTPKAKEVVQEIIEQAAVEVGYRPPQFAFDLQIMMLPDKGMVLTFSEKDPLESKEGKAFLDYLREVQKTLSGKNTETKQEPQKKKDEEIYKPEKAVFAFETIEDILRMVGVLPRGLRVDSALYKMEDTYYLLLQKGGASYDKYSRICICAMEYGEIFGANEDGMLYLQEHGQCLVEEKVLNKFQKCL